MEAKGKGGRTICSSGLRTTLTMLTGGRTPTLGLVRSEVVKPITTASDPAVVTVAASSVVGRASVTGSPTSAVAMMKYAGSGWGAWATDRWGPTGCSNVRRKKTTTTKTLVTAMSW